MEEKIKIAVLQDGPYLVKGEFLIIDAAGNEYPAVRRTVALCRCGGSANKPFCDGAQKRSGSRRRRMRTERLFPGEPGCGDSADAVRASRWRPRRSATRWKAAWRSCWYKVTARRSWRS